MEYITKPSMTRLARKAGIKSVSEDCFPVLHDVIGSSIKDVVKAALVVNSARDTKTLMAGDIQDAFRIKGLNVAHSTELGTGTCSR